MKDFLLNYKEIRVYNVDHCDTLQCAPVGVIPFGDVLPRSMAPGDTFCSSVYVVLNQSY